mgnify:CR=1 FL=1
MQIDNLKRGFSFRADGPLDFRLNQEKGISAAERLDTISRARSTKMCWRLRHASVLYAKNEDSVKRIKSIDSKTKNYYNKPIIKIC